MEVKETRKYIRSRIKRESINPLNLGGQSCGIPNPTVRLISEDLGIKIEISILRSKLKNFEYGMMLMDLVIMDQIN